VCSGFLIILVATILSVFSLSFIALIQGFTVSSQDFSFPWMVLSHLRVQIRYVASDISIRRSLVAPSLCALLPLSVVWGKCAGAGLSVRGSQKGKMPLHSWVVGRSFDKLSRHRMYCVSVRAGRSSFPSRVSSQCFTPLE
jgi:hypothetical protein